MNFNFEESIRQLIAEELDKRQEKNERVPLQRFCKEYNLNRSTIWRAEKEGRITLHRIGKKIFINPTEFFDAQPSRSAK